MPARFVVGQRWASITEPQLGLGIIAEVSGRLVTVSFPAVAERRIYAAEQPPLNRVVYQSGDEIVIIDEKRLTVIELYKNQGLVIYDCRDGDGWQYSIAELELNSFITFMSPLQRLFNVQTDPGDAFSLRIATIEFLDRLQHVSAKGLIGSRISLLPHQLYITHEVSKRFEPRVLLADEVGLGKTIEAGMILTQQLHAGHISRVLIVVPPGLIHQWFVEMRRRFNLHFSIFDSDRINSHGSNAQDGIQLSIEQGAGDPGKSETSVDTALNPFETEQLILCPVDLLTSDAKCMEDLIAAGFDLLIVDEAHHLHWTRESSSPEYDCISQLCETCAGVLLLTATPESIGIECYFAQLALLDGSRFHDLEIFKQEQRSYLQLGKLVERLLQLIEQSAQSAQKIQLEPLLYDELAHLLPANSIKQNSLSKQQLSKWIEYLVDVHGTSRILFRNTRSAIGGFQQRKLIDYPLDTPNQYSSIAARKMLYPENQFEDTAWLKFDPRVQWLVKLLLQLSPAKVLLICAHVKTAMQLERYLQLSRGISSAAFHERLSIVERDRAAAYFADEIQGAQVLICSEIGSEGRNFQFANHLILFDLPVNPDLLEQRIGRLDRIGQSGAIHIHVPYLRGTAQELLFLLYEQGLNQFAQTFSPAQRLIDENRKYLLELIDGWPDNHGAVDLFIKQIQEKACLARRESAQGKDKLLEYNSCRLDISQGIIEEITKFEQDVCFDAYLEQIFDAFNIEYHEHSEKIKIIEQTGNISNEIFTKLNAGRLTITTDRATALAREDIEYLNFKHPMIEDVMDFIVTGNFGNLTVSSISLKNIKPGSIFMEAYFATECLAPVYMQLQRFLPLSPLRFVLDDKHHEIGQLLTHHKLNKFCKGIDIKVINSVLPVIRPKIEAMLNGLEKTTGKHLAELQAKAIKDHQQCVNIEIQRLESLQKINSSVRNEEIDFFKRQIDEAKEHMQRATYKLQAIRIILNV